MANVIGLDLATRLNGWCAGNGQSVPTAGAIQLPQVGEDIGEMLHLLDVGLDGLFARFPPDLVIFEAPILPNGPGRSTTLVRRKLFNLGGHTEFMCKRRGIECLEGEVRQIKRELAGFSMAGKGDMVAAAEKVGIVLPVTLAAGREDAADAFGAWLLGMRHADKATSAKWDSRLYGSRGALL